MVTFFGTAIPLLLITALLVTKHLWGPYGPNWLNAMTDQRVALLGMVAGNAAVAAIIRIIARPENQFGAVFAGIAGVATIGAGHAHLTDVGSSWQAQALAAFIALTLIPATPSFAIRIHNLHGGFTQVFKSEDALLLLFGILFVISVLMAEWVNDGAIARMQAIAFAIGRAMLTVAGGLFGLSVIGYFGWMTWKLILFLVRKIRRKL